MRTDKHVKENLRTPSQRQRTLANITNLSVSASWASEVLSKTSIKSSSQAQLREENASLKRLLLEKEMAIETQAAQLDQMQKEFFVQFKRQAQVNEELIIYNSRLSRDGVQLRDQLKLLQHEYSQMTVAYRISQSEMQVKLAESQESLTRLLEQADKSTSSNQSIPPKIPRKLRSSRTYRRHSVGTIIIEANWNSSTEMDSGRSNEDTKRSDVSKRLASGGMDSKETAIGLRQTQPQSENSATVAPYRVQHTKLYGDLIGLEPMLEDCCEEDSPRKTTSESSSTSGDDSRKTGKSASDLTSESVNSRQTSRSIESVAAAVPPACAKRVQSLNTTKENQKVHSRASVSSSASAPHFSRRLAGNSLNTGPVRPVRRAVEKVASYLEPSLNAKLRRPS